MVHTVLSKLKRMGACVYMNVCLVEVPLPVFTTITGSFIIYLKENSQHCLEYVSSNNTICICTIYTTICTNLNFLNLHEYKIVSLIVQKKKYRPFYKKVYKKVS